LAVLVDLHDVGMGQAGGGLRFALETAQHFRLRLRIERALIDELDRQRAVQDRVPAFVHSGHGAFAEHATNLVARDGGWDVHLLAWGAARGTSFRRPRSPAVAPPLQAAPP